jgi:hypothetical protein
MVFSRFTAIKHGANISPVGIFDYLYDDHTDDFSSSSRPTLERRIRMWRHLHSPAQDVMFRIKGGVAKFNVGVFFRVSSIPVQLPQAKKKAYRKISLFNIMWWSWRELNLFYMLLI